MHIDQLIDQPTRPASGLFAEALRCSVGEPDDLGRALFVMLTALMRPKELVCVARVADGWLHLPRIPYGAARSVPLGHFAGCAVGQGPTSLQVALGVQPGAEVDFLARLQRASSAALGASLEQLWATAIEALVEAAPSAAERRAVFAYGGVGSLDADSGLLDTVPALIDVQVRAAGF